MPPSIVITAKITAITAKTNIEGIVVRVSGLPF